MIAAFVLPHVANHALGLASLDVMTSVSFAWLPWMLNPVGLAILYGAFAVHIALAVFALWRRRTLKMPVWEAAQLALGLLVPLILVQHVMGTRGATLFGAGGVAYPGVVLGLWLDGWSALQQAAFLVVVWAHLCIGFHYWLRLRPWYARARVALTIAAILLPVLGLLGFARAGWEAARKAADDPAWGGEELRGMRPEDPAAEAARLRTTLGLLGGYLGILALILAARGLRHAGKRRAASVKITYPSGRTVVAPAGLSILEISRFGGVPHTSVCGGRARCTTCRIRVADGAENLPPANHLETEALRRVNAEPNVRLACQTRPSGACTVFPLIPPRSPSALGAVEKPDSFGRERQVAVLFIDLRGSTTLAEGKLPFDVVFYLNQFFAEMSDAIDEAGGHYSNFTGDGLMALFGLESNVKAGVRDALAAALAMLRRLDHLNQRLENELRQPLKMGIGIHSGVAIVGMMGPPKTPILTALGDTINTCARLESLTKSYGVDLVVSEAAARAGGLDLSGFARHEAEAKGKAETVPMYAIPWPGNEAVLAQLSQAQTGKGRAA